MSLGYEAGLHCWCRVPFSNHLCRRCCHVRGLYRDVCGDVRRLPPDGVCTVDRANCSFDHFRTLCMTFGYLTRGYDDRQSCCLISELGTTGTEAGSRVGGGFPLDSCGDFLAREIVMRRSCDIELKHLHAPERRPATHGRRRLASMGPQGCSDNMVPPSRDFLPPLCLCLSSHSARFCAREPLRCHTQPWPALDRWTIM